MAFKPNCNIKYDRKPEEALVSTDNFLIAHNIINKRRDILDLGKFREALSWLNKKANEKAYFPESLYIEVDRGKKAIPNYTMFGKLNGINKSSSKQTIEQVEEIKLSPDEELSEQMRLEQENRENLQYQLRNQSQINQQSLKEGLEWLKKVLPQSNIKLTQGLIDNLGNASYNSIEDLMTFSIEYANKGSVKHEAIHSILNKLPEKQKEDILNEASKRFNIPRGKSITKVKYQSIEQENHIKYVFKTILIIQDNIKKIKSWEENKSIKLEDFWNKIQQLGIPKEQIALLKESNGDTIEDKLVDFAANYSHTIEINTAKTIATNSELADEKEYFNFNGFTYQISDGKFKKNSEVITEEQYNIAYNTALENKPNTSYYSNLTVPGGTNYTERNFETPLIKVPKSHAQFNTENTIGFTRGDDRVIYREEDIEKLLNIMESSGILKIKCN